MHATCKYTAAGATLIATLTSIVFTFLHDLCRLNLTPTEHYGLTG